MIDLKALNCPKCGGPLDIISYEKVTRCSYCSTYSVLSTDRKVTNSFDSLVECQDIILLEIFIEEMTKVRDDLKEKREKINKREKNFKQKIRNEIDREMFKKYDVNKMEYKIRQGKLAKKKMNEYQLDKKSSEIQLNELYKDELSEIIQEQKEIEDIYLPIDTDLAIAKWKLATIKYDIFNSNYTGLGKNLPENSLKKPFIMLSKKQMIRELLKAYDRGGETEAIQIFHEFTGFPLPEAQQKVSELISKHE